MASTSSSRPSLKAESTLERFAAGIDRIYEEEKAAVGAADAAAMRRAVKLARFCEVRGRRLLAEASSGREYLRGVWFLASYYMMEMTNGHGVTHGAYDDVGRPFGVDTATYDWQTAVDTDDWAMSHNGFHHVYTNQVGKDVDFGFALFRVSGRTPWRPWHLLQPAALLVAACNVTVANASYSSVARAKHEGRPVWSRRTLEPVLREILAEWRRNYIDEPRKAGPRFAQVVAGNFAAKFISNTFIGGLLTGCGHHAPDVLDFDVDPDEPLEVAYLRVVLSTQNWRAGARFEERYGLGTCNHIEHHLFPDIPLNRLPGVEVKVRALCEELGIPHRERSWVAALGGIFETALIYAFPVRTTRSRERVREAYARLVEEHDVVRRARANAEGASSPRTTHVVRLARSKIDLQVSSSSSLLEALETAGVTVPSSCRKGACKTCAVTKLSGRTSLERHQRRSVIELCVARPITDLVLDI